jgi:hypothetical protein
VGLTNSYQEKNILIAKGIWTKGVVTDKYKFYKRNTGIKYEFKTLNGIIIKSTADDESDNPFWIGDSIEVIYHPDIPELNRIDIEME